MLLQCCHYCMNGYDLTRNKRLTLEFKYYTIRVTFEKEKLALLHDNKKYIAKRIQKLKAWSQKKSMTT